MRYILLQGDLVGGKAERRRLHLEHQLIDSEASVSPHAVSGSRDGNHLRREGGMVGRRGVLSPDSTKLQVVLCSHSQNTLVPGYWNKVSDMDNL